MENNNPKELYNVEKILSKRIRNKKVEYRVKWEGYPISQSTWEPVAHLKDVQGVIDKYEEKKNKKPVEPKLLNKKKKRDKSDSKALKTVAPKMEKKSTIITDIDKILIQGIITVNLLEKELHGEVEYDDNGKIKKGWVSTKLLKKAVPQLLIDYYEQQIIFN